MCKQLNLQLIDPPVDLVNELKRFVNQIPNVILLDENTDLSVCSRLVFISAERPKSLGKIPWVFYANSATQSLEAWHNGAMGFLHLPLTKDQVENVVERATQWYSLMNAEEPFDEGNRFFEVIFKGKINRIRIAQIIRLESDGNGTIVYFENGRVEKRVSSKSLTQVLETMRYEKIIQIDRKHAVNQDYIQSLHGNDIHISDGTVLTVSRRRMPNLETTIGR